MTAVTSSPEVSVIICAHNPRGAYLRRVLDALHVQTLPKTEWELLLVDNASGEPLSASCNLAWHPHARHVREDQLGLVFARLRGIKESRGALLVFVDDDNILDANYLETARDIARGFPQVGAFGASIRGEFESPPPDWITPYLDGLAVCELTRDHCSHAGGWSLASPYGAGLCVRRAVADDYADKARKTPARTILGRSGTRLGAGEDSDLAWCAIDIGLGTGRFCALKLTHLISSNRLTEDYIIGMCAGFAAAAEVAAMLRPSRRRRRRVVPLKRLARMLFEYAFASGIRKKIVVASYRAQREARRMMEAEPSRRIR